MIKCDKGLTKIEGSGTEILAEFTCIFKEMLIVAPEIVLGVQCNFVDDLEKAMGDSDKFKVNAIVKLLSMLPKGEI